MKLTVVILICAILMVLFAIAAMSSGMWGCGPTCAFFSAAFAVALALVSLSVCLLVRRRKPLSHESNKRTQQVAKVFFSSQGWLRETVHAALGLLLGKAFGELSNRLVKSQLKMGDLYYEVRGSGKPLLILHGGYLDHRHMMDAIEPSFEDSSNWKRIYPDMPGHGQTTIADDIDNHDQVLEV